MQPYFLPYIGYWQLIHSVDKFVILDDVQYITKGWINRNKIIVKGKEQWVTIPLKDANRNRMINEIEICDKTEWLPKIKRSITYNFSKSIFFEDIVKLLNGILDYEENNLSKFLIKSISSICEYLGIRTELLVSSSFSPRKESSGQARIIEICKKLRADSYINLPGGKNLYSFDCFESQSINLKFLDKVNETERQYSILENLFNESAKKINVSLVNK